MPGKVAHDWYPALRSVKQKDCRFEAGSHTGSFRARPEKQ